MFEHVNVEGSDELDELFLQASQSYESEHCIESGMPNVPVTRSSHGGERKLLQVVLVPVMALLRVLRLLGRYGSLQFQRRRG